MKTDSPFLDLQRNLTDPAGESLINSLFTANLQKELHGALSMEMSLFPSIENKDLRQFLIAQKPKPSWYDAKKIERGQAFFYKQALPIMTLLGALSLPYCYAASPGNKALYFSEKMRKSTHKRLLDTAEFIIGVSSPDSLAKDGSGHFFINKIRLIHAMARYYILDRQEWDADWGAPINQEDMAGTNLAFSYLILKGLKQSGYSVTERETESFLYLWKYIGYQLHLTEELLPNNYKEAAALENAIRERHFKPSKEGEVLTAEIVAYYKTIVPNQTAANLMEAQIRYLLGPFVADCLGLPANSVKDTVVKTMNTLRKNTLFLTHKTPSYEQMLSNQRMLKAKMGLS